MIDCAMETSAKPCIEAFASRDTLKYQYHLPSQLGMTSLLECTELPDAAIVYGSHSNVGENLDWHAPLADYILSLLEKGIPVLGICFGHQLIANALGMDVGIREEKDQDEFSREVMFIESGYAFSPEDRYELYVAHDYEVKGTHPEMLRLATSNACLNEVLAHRTLPFLGIQAHPEGTESFVQGTYKFPISVERKEQLEKSGHKFLSNYIMGLEKFWQTPSSPLLYRD